MKGILTKAEKFSKEIKYIRCHAVIFKDKNGEVIYTFEDKKKADQFFKELTNQSK